MEKDDKKFLWNFLKSRNLVQIILVNNFSLKVWNKVTISITWNIDKYFESGKSGSNIVDVSLILVYKWEYQIEN